MTYPSAQLECVYLDACAEQVSGPCAVPTGHRRLADAHFHFHAAAEQYFEPRAFRASLNATLQAIRAVTFVVQKEHALVSDFDSWYPVWQTRMRDDARMVWMKDARNTVEKEGDLTGSSVAHIDLLIRYGVAPLVSYDVPPSLTAASMAQDFRERRISNFDLDTVENGLLRVRRSWRPSSAPDYELLDLLAYGLHFLDIFLTDAHINQRSSHPALTDVPRACLRSLDEYRESYIRLRDEKMLRSGFRLKEMTRDNMRSFLAEARYGRVDRPHDDTPETLVATLIERAKSILQQDGYHHTILILYASNGQPIAVPFKFEKPADKNMLMQNIARMVEVHRVIRVQMVGETWLSEAPIQDGVVHADQKILRGEALSVLVADYLSGREILTTIPFTRTPEGFVFDKPRDGGHFFMLAPIRTIWDKWRKG